jgi:hypothetical protein
MSTGEVKMVNGKRVATPEYRSWQMMKNRVLNPKARDYSYYGGRGIRMDPRWNDFDNFLTDMGRKPGHKLTLERKDSNGHYCKRNCVWATRQTQSRNRAYVKFSLSKAEKVRELYASGKFYQWELAAKFNTSQAHISQITRGVSWRKETGQ